MSLIEKPIVSGWQDVEDVDDTDFYKGNDVVDLDPVVARK